MHDPNAQTLNRRSFNEAYKRLEKLRHTMKQHKKVRDTIDANNRDITAAKAAGTRTFQNHAEATAKRLHNLYLKTRAPKSSKKIEKQEHGAVTLLHRKYGYELNGSLVSTEKMLNSLQEYRKTSMQNSMERSLKTSEALYETAYSYRHLQNFENNIKERKKFIESRLEEIDKDITNIQKDITWTLSQPKVDRIHHTQLERFKKGLRIKEEALKAEINQIEEDRKKAREHIKEILPLQQKVLLSKGKEMTKENRALQSRITKAGRESAKIATNPAFLDATHKNHAKLAARKDTLDKEVQASTEKLAQNQYFIDKASSSSELINHFNEAKKLGTDEKKEEFARKYLEEAGKKKTGDLSARESAFLKEHEATKTAGGSVDINLANRIFDEGETLIGEYSAEAIENFVGKGEGDMSQEEKALFMVQGVFAELMEKQMKFYNTFKEPTPDQATEIATLRRQTKHLEEQLKKFQKEKNPEKKKQCMLRLLTSAYDTLYSKENFSETAEAKKAGLTLENMLNDKNAVLKMRVVKSQMLQRRLEQKAQKEGKDFPYKTSSDLIFRENTKGKSHTFKMETPPASFLLPAGSLPPPSPAPGSIPTPPGASPDSGARPLGRRASTSDIPNFGDPPPVPGERPRPESFRERLEEQRRNSVGGHSRGRSHTS